MADRGGAVLTPIWTLGARDNVFLDAVAAEFNLSWLEMNQEILGAHTRTIQILADKDLQYEGMKNALIPRKERSEAAFVFDSTAIDSGWYGFDVASALIPLLPKCCSILSGDLTLEDQMTASKLLEPHIPLGLRHSTSLYCVYLNNLTPNIISAIDAGLRSSGFYEGHIVTTYASPMKEWLSFVLVNDYLKLGSNVIGVNDDDDDVDRNVLGWPWEEHGHSVYSVADPYFSLFLSYKIERMVHRGFESDTLHSLSAISAAPESLRNFRVTVAEKKAEYLRKEKAGSLASAGINITVSGLEALILDRINGCYIYNLRVTHGASLFDLMLEVQNPKHSTPSRIIAAMEYISSTHELRLVTLF